MKNYVKTRWFKNNGTETNNLFKTLEDAILAYRQARKRGGASFGKYCLDGENWLWI